mgnify:CR=1 FL=1
MSARLWVIAYDVADPRRLRRVAKLLENRAVRVQESVFEGYFTPPELAGLQTALRTLIEPAADSLRYYPVCPGCRESIEWQGPGGFDTDASYYLV